MIAFDLALCHRMVRLAASVLHRGMKKRGNAYYFRVHKRSGEQWVALGKDYYVACAKLREMKAEPVVFSSTVVAEVVQWWLKHYVATTRNEKNQKIARQRAEDYLLKHLGTQPIGRVTADHLRGYRLWLERTHLSRQTVAHILSDARCFFRWCQDSEYVARSPFPPRLMPRIQERPPDRFSDEEAETLMRIEEPWGFVMRFALATGLRWGELVKARARDVRGSVLIVHGTKSGKVRRVPLPESILGELRGRVGLLVPPGNYWHSVQRLRRLSGLAKFHPHQTRHTFACRWLERGGSLSVLKEILGHSSVSVTERYARLTDHAIRAEAGRVGELWGKSGS